MFSSRIIFLNVIGLLVIVASVNSQCCSCIDSTCGDYTLCGGYPDYCCSYQSCDIFCCNCKAGCRTNLDVKQNGNETEAVDFLSKIDENFSGDVDFEEFNNYNAKNNMPQDMLVYTIFTLLDENGDGYITTKEFNTAILK